MTRGWVLVLATGCNAVFGVDDLVPGSGGASAVSNGTGGSLAMSSAAMQSSVASGHGGAVGIGGAGGGVVSVAGCSDDTRELFGDATAEPNIAGCSGAWSVPGVKTPDSQQPQCNRNAGNDAVPNDGVGCSVADLCAAGWHVCEGAAEVALRSANGACPSTYSMLGLWVARQGQESGVPAGTCSATGVNNLTGCGAGFGLTAHETCAPLDRQLNVSTCADTTAWQCGTIISEECNYVTKTDPSEGGVLCCRD